MQFKIKQLKLPGQECPIEQGWSQVMLCSLIYAGIEAVIVSYSGNQ